MCCPKLIHASPMGLTAKTACGGCCKCTMLPHHHFLRELRNNSLWKVPGCPPALGGLSWQYSGNISRDWDFSDLRATLSLGSKIRHAHRTGVQARQQLSCPAHPRALLGGVRHSPRSKLWGFQVACANFTFAAQALGVVEGSGSQRHGRR